MSTVSPAASASSGTSFTFAYVLPGPTSYVVAMARPGTAVSIAAASAVPHKKVVFMEPPLQGNWPTYRSRTAACQTQPHRISRGGRDTGRALVSGEIGEDDDRRIA